MGGPIWRASDGREFKTEEAAAYWDKTKELRALLVGILGDNYGKIQSFDTHRNEKAANEILSTPEFRAMARIYLRE